MNLMRAESRFFSSGWQSSSFNLDAGSYMGKSVIEPLTLRPCAILVLTPRQAIYLYLGEEPTCPGFWYYIDMDGQTVLSLRC